LRDIAVAVGALTFAFTILFVDPIRYGFVGDAVFLVSVVVVSFIAVLTGFLMHELAHKFAAVRYGLWAEFRANPRGLLLAIFTALFGIVFAAPGAVMIAGPVDRRRNGIISVVGPLTNLAFGGGCFAILFALNSYRVVEPILLFLLLYQIVMVNLVLGVFNMIPVPPMDGSKVFRWNKPLWAGLITVFIVLLAYVLLA